jgi:hypothetical protein
MPKRSHSSKKGAKKTRRPKRAARVRRMRALPDNETRVDGCDVEFPASDATPDGELPKATGGVETSAVRRRKR